MSVAAETEGVTPVVKHLKQSGIRREKGDRRLALLYCDGLTF